MTYASYLKVPELLALQVERSSGPDGPEHDELLFIVVHQVYELWFKSLRHELLAVQLALENGDTDRALHLLNRVLKILKTLVAQVDVLETMTPMQFLSFRDRLDSASGFQSAGFRAIEATLGARDSAAVEAQPEGSPGRAAIEEAQAGTSVWESFLGYLAERGHPVPADAGQGRQRGEGRWPSGKSSSPKVTMGVNPSSQTQAPSHTAAVPKGSPPGLVTAAHDPGGGT